MTKRKLIIHQEASIVAECLVFDGVIQKERFISLFFVFASVRSDNLIARHFITLSAILTVAMYLQAAITSAIKGSGL